MFGCGMGYIDGFTSWVKQVIGLCLITFLQATVLVAEIEMLCLNSRESFEDNKRFLRSRMEKEENPVVRRLLEKNQAHLDRIQVQMATAREFLIMVRLREKKESEVFPYLSRIEKSLKEQGFSVALTSFCKYNITHFQVTFRLNRYFAISSDLYITLPSI